MLILDQQKVKKEIQELTHQIKQLEKEKADLLTEKFKYQKKYNFTIWPIALRTRTIERLEEVNTFIEEKEKRLEVLLGRTQLTLFS